MNLVVAPVRVNGEIVAYPSKSLTQRFVASAILAEGESVINNPSFCDDAMVAVDIARQLGAKVEQHNDHWHIVGGIDFSSDTYHCGESGLCARLFAPILALSDRVLILDGATALRKRPMEMVIAGLRQMGGDCFAEDVYLPLRIKGPVSCQQITIDGSISSQFLSGLLFACATLDQNTCIKVVDLKSKPYVDMTIQVLGYAGVQVENQDYERFVIRGGQHFGNGNYRVEGDWSGAAFMLVAGAIAGKVWVHDLSLITKQADAAILEVLLSAGIEIEAEGDGILVSRPAVGIQAFEYDAQDCPDLVPAMVVLALFAKGQSVIKGVGRLIYKESSRAHALITEFSKLGGKIGIQGDALWVEGGRLKAAVVSSHHDHRIAMALAVAALGAKGEVVIQAVECIAKSYPEFIDDLKKIAPLAVTIRD